MSRAPWHPKSHGGTPPSRHSNGQKGGVVRVDHLNGAASETYADGRIHVVAKDGSNYVTYVEPSTVLQGAPSNEQKGDGSKIAAAPSFLAYIGQLQHGDAVAYRMRVVSDITGGDLIIDAIQGSGIASARSDVIDATKNQ